MQAITEQSSVKFTELFRTKYGTFIRISQTSVFCCKKFHKFYRTLFCNRLYPRLLNSSIKFIELFFSAQGLRIGFVYISFVTS